MTKDQKIRICQIVAQGVLADGQVTDDEHAVLDRLIAGFELDAADRKTIFSGNIGDDVSHLAADLTAESRTALLTELILAVAADGQLTRAERQLVEGVATAIGVEIGELEPLYQAALA